MVEIKNAKVSTKCNSKEFPKLDRFQVFAVTVAYENIETKSIKTKNWKSSDEYARMESLWYCFLINFLVHMATNCTSSFFNEELPFSINFQRSKIFNNWQIAMRSENGLQKQWKRRRDLREDSKVCILVESYNWHSFVRLILPGAEQSESAPLRYVPFDREKV